MYQIRVHRTVGTNKVRTLKIKKAGNWFGIWGLLRLWFTIRKAHKEKVASLRDIKRDCPARTKVLKKKPLRFQSIIKAHWDIDVKAGKKVAVLPAI